MSTSGADDYHVIAKPKTHQLISTLIRYQSNYRHLATITRHDSRIGLPALHAKDQIIDIRLGARRFSREETLDFVEKVVDTRIGVQMILLPVVGNQ